MLPRETIAEFDEFLAIRGLGFEAVVVGGSALALLGILGRALVLRTLARSDLLKVKLFALCDRGTDLAEDLARRLGHGV